ncbi:RsmB/NOP family class I SAM-dependent RNA methyltransferase [Lactobacillus xylocopicola]|uniref:RNA methyltransferase n=1 Tax=Lactobacillus xylocopicola TaxID=2976676 RepID=A0ABM8BGV7_9LACO|nr:RsmB/NOP family class I SAM-dependent RNA methyltransferase [Lactobacillus xylocopicola]BDR60518.1 RNA methyltransferase [Lactobacillus xylocopicola]
MLNLPTTFCQKYRDLLGEGQAEELFAAMADAPQKAYRINQLKSFQQVSYSQARPVPGISNAWYGQVGGRDPEWVSGTVYSQEPAAMFPAYSAAVQPGDRVLDLCAAPGGKSTAIGEALRGQGLLVANEISASRAQILRENIERWGIANALVTSAAPASLAAQFPQFFDKILVDAPCSGEGMFRKNPAAAQYWSQDYVLTCQRRQQEILLAAVKMLKPGGELIYSTCTFAPEENEQIVSWLVEQFDFQVQPLALRGVKVASGRPEWAQGETCLSQTIRFWPFDGLGEGQFVAKLRLPGQETQPCPSPKKKLAKPKIPQGGLTRSEQELVATVLDYFTLPTCLAEWANRSRVSHGHVFIPVLPPANLHVKVVNNGSELGLLKKNRFEPGHQLAMLLGQVKQERVIDLSAAAYLSYLHGETLPVKTALRGFVLVSYHNFIFSFGKVAGNGILKNFYPKGLRILKKD